MTHAVQACLARGPGVNRCNVCDLWVGFSTQLSPLETHPGCCVLTACSFLSVVLLVDGPQCVQPGTCRRGIWVVSGLGSYEQSCCKNSPTLFFLMWNGSLASDRCLCLVLRIHQTGSQVAVVVLVSPAKPGSSVLCFSRSRGSVWMRVAQPLSLVADDDGHHFLCVCLCALFGEMSFSLECGSASVSWCSVCCLCGFLISAHSP